MALTLTQADRKHTWASWHNDTDTNRNQAQLLAMDAKATQEKLLKEALLLHLGLIPTDSTIARLITERPEPNTPLIWVCWGKQAIAVRTDPKSHVKDCTYNLVWYWKTLPKAA